MKAKAVTKPILTQPNLDKLALIRGGKRRKSITGFKEAKNITFSNKEGKFIAVEKEKKFEEAGVTRKKRNFIMFESKLGTERERDLRKIGKVYDTEAKERIQEKIYITKKKKEYLDNYQYHETKNLKLSQPDVVVHKRLGGPVGGTYEETTTKKVTTRIQQRGGSVDAKKAPPKPTKPAKPAQSLRNRPQSSSGTKTKETTTKIGRRGGADGKYSSTTTTKKETRTTTTTKTRGAPTKFSSKTTTTTTRGKK